MGSELLSPMEGAGQALVSIVVPAYNVQDYIEACLESVLAQTYGNFQLIVVDDGSTDTTGTLCDEIAAKDLRAMVIHQENEGLSGARNKGLAAAQGEYVTFLDGDDMLAPAFLERTVAAAVQFDVPLVASEYDIIPPDTTFEGDATEGCRVVSGQEASRMVVGEGRTSMITACGKLYRKELWPLLHYPKGKANEDEFVTYKAMYTARQVAILNARLYGYVQRPGSIMTNLGLRSLDALEGLQGAIEYFEGKNEPELARWARKRYAFHIMTCYYRIRVSDECSSGVLGDLKTLFDCFMKSYGAEILPLANILLRIQFAVFKMSPELYVKFASLYLRKSGYH